MNLNGKSIKTSAKIFLFSIFFKNAIAADKSNLELNSYFSNPITYYLGFGGGFNVKSFPLYTDCSQNPGKASSHQLIFLSPSFSVLWTLVNKFCCNNFGGYPELGFKLKYSRTSNEGNIGSLLLKFSPARSYDSSFEMVPSFGIGGCYMSIPAWKRLVGFHPITTPGQTPQKYEEPESKYSSVPFRKEMGLEAEISLDTIIRFKEHWKAKLSLGLSVIPSFTKDTTEEAQQYVEAGYKNVVDLNKNEDESTRLRKIILKGVDTTLVIPYVELYVGYTTNTTDIKFDTDEVTNSFVKIKPFYTVRNYDKDSEFLWSLLQDMMLNELNNNSKSEPSRNYSQKVTPTIKSKESLYRYDYYHVFGMALEWNILFAKRASAILGFEVAYDSSSQKLYKNLFIPRNYPIELSFNLGLGYVSGKLSIDNILGIYLINPKMPLKFSGIFQNILYYKLGLDYKILGNLTVGCNFRVKVAFKYNDYDDAKFQDLINNFGLDNLYNLSFEACTPEISIGYNF